MNSSSNNILDYPEERYLKTKKTAEKFQIIQIGLCLFMKTNQNNTNNSNEFIVKPYSFYLFPEDYSGNPFITCETSAIIFNREHKMDFNKWIYEGN